jgi:hypothetical protein
MSGRVLRNGLIFAAPLWAVIGLGVVALGLAVGWW